MTFGFRDPRGAETGIDTGFKKGTLVLPAISVQQVGRLIGRRGSHWDKEGAEFQAAADRHAHGVPGGMRRLPRPGRPTW